MVNKQLLETHLHDFITGLQFLTRIKVARQTHWSAESFGRSVKFFPLIGLILGMLLLLLNYLLTDFLPQHGWNTPMHVQAALLLAAGIFLTGGLHCDGFMDSMDGLFSGRSPERMLEIMKDSRVGANGVMGFGLLLLIKWSLLLDIAPGKLPLALLVMPVAGRLAMVIGITAFPYARPDGIGKAFAQFAGKHALYIALILTTLLLLPLGKSALLAMVYASLAALCAGLSVSRKLGGLTGDIYGLLSEIGELMVLVTYLY